jgi:SAM-dependent methyltransferase
MVEEYNQYARAIGIPAERMEAIQGDLLASGDDTPPSHPAEHNSFDLVIMSMALHHVQDTALMVKKLAEHLRPGGKLVIIDWVEPAESGCPSPEMPPDHPSEGIITRQGFAQKTMYDLFADAHLEDPAWLLPARSLVPMEMGSEQQLFFARAAKPI